MGIPERDICSEGYWGKAGETLNGIEVRTSEGSRTDYSNVRRKYLMPGKAARWGEGGDEKLHGVIEVKAGNQLRGGGVAAAVTCEHGTCTHGINYALSEHVQFVVNLCDNESCGMLVSNCYSYQDIADYSIVRQIVTNINGSIVWSRCGVSRSGANKNQWCLSITV
jgi:hypothetical protein